ncbi:hypothetical protein DIURU_002208 [Diutina rugosa]|uniref:Uncharacterized protein n=1 Tax=Diutina rugosa TaxID=5481 RepID=A0A642UQR9_DIURU|nr:uncharacterized protein DIURU_002208 [Diutina rugosa]KAA8903697.1 hypothetical protein DIURU_002208 [Diutina rugosa]
MAISVPIFFNKDFNVYNRVYTTFDTFLYYVINILMCVLIFGEMVVEQVESVWYSINIVKASVQHKLYNNIN